MFIDPYVSLFLVYLVPFALAILGAVVLYFVVRLAVLHGMKSHTQ